MKTFFTALIFLVYATISFCQTFSQKIEQAYSVFENDPQLKYGLSSLTVLNAETGELIFSKNGDIALAPASTLKTITSATAFAILGKDYKWETTLGYNGIISNGVLKGDLILKGSGDPTLGSKRYSQTKPEVLLEKWINAVKSAGIKKIEGSIVVDDSLFGTQTIPAGWIWQDIGNYYGAGSTSASWRENEFGLMFRPGSKPGEPVELTRTEPLVPDVKIVNEVTTGNPGSGDNVYAYSAPYSSIIYVRGTYGIDLKKMIMISIPDPALFLANELKDKLTKSGIPSRHAATTARILSMEGRTLETTSNIISSYQSPSLSQVVYWLNQKSLNLYAENVLKTFALKQGKKATFQEGIEVLRDYWSKRGIEANSVNVLDGSGLSPENRVSTKSMSKILQLAKQEPWFNSFFESLPLYNNMKMKSGSIRNVLCYTGYEKTAQGIPVVFTFMTNNYNGSTSGVKQKMFRVLDSLK